MSDAEKELEIITIRLLIEQSKIVSSLLTSKVFRMHSFK
jgi:hypothetical protein